MGTMPHETRPQRICIVDDDPKTVDLVRRYLRQNGYEHVEGRGAEELVARPRIDYDLVILDIMMPGMDGFECCRRIREKSDAFVIFLSGRDETFDRVTGLEMGADDYLTKPFAPRELLARMERLFRRQRMSGSRPAEMEGVFRCREFEFDMDRQVVLKGGAETPLTTYEFLLLRYFCRNAGLVLTRTQIEAHLEENEFYSSGRSVDKGVSRLRQKLAAATGAPELLKTVWGRGYQLVVGSS